jgi:hypothetical protein
VLQVSTLHQSIVCTVAVPEHFGLVVENAIEQICVGFEVLTAVVVKTSILLYNAM